MALKDLIRRITAGAAGAADAPGVGPDKFPLPPEHPLSDEHLRLGEYLKERASGRNWWEIKARNFESGRAILDLDRESQVRVARAVVERLAWVAHASKRVGERWHRLNALLRALLTRQLPFAPEDPELLLGGVITALERVSAGELGFSAEGVPLAPLLRLVEREAAERGLSPEMRSALERLRIRLADFPYHPEGRNLLSRAELLLSDGAMDALKRADSWAGAMHHDLAGIEPAAQLAWNAFLAHALAADASRPSGKWLREAERLIRPIGEDRFRACAARWLSLLRDGADTPLDQSDGDFLKGLLWACRLFEDAALARAVAAAAEACYRKVPGWGLRLERAGNAAVNTLAAMPGQEPVAQLSRLQLRVKHRTALRNVEKALAEASERSGLGTDELAEISVPTFGMEGPGLLEQPLGDYTAIVQVTGANSTDWQWCAADGRLQKSVPAAVKEGHKEELAALKKQVTELQKMLPAQRDRLERLLLSERSWTLAQWQERYLEHPLLAPLTRRLTWHFTEGDRKLLAIPHAGQLTDVEGRPVEGLSPETEVRLWHPLGFAPEVVLRWRVWLEEHGVTQPFKQAHREVYLLTEAELNTRTYSNRFAAHVLKQHQLNALCAARGWTYRLQGAWDSAYEPVAGLQIPRWGLRAEFWVEVFADEGHTDSGVYQYVCTDQVRFYRTESPEPLPLTEVPALVFTEVMRDVDLFVGVASVGNDPAWQDSGEQRDFGDYWHRYSFGDLSASAETRRELLQRLLPRLKIRERCALDGRFLRVRGDLREYKIHLGSGNILMEPNDQYLCIVPGRGPGSGDAEGVFLPFEGDRMLSIILSKAFLLAEDRKITDPSITSQIGRSRRP